MRAVQPASEGSGPITFRGGSVTTSPAAPDNKAANNYLDRVRAYVPVEVIAFFIFVNALVDSEKVAKFVDLKSLTNDQGIALAGLVVGALATIVYARMAATANKTTVWGVQAAISLVAFLVWAYAMGAQAFVVLGMASVPAVAGFLLATFTMISGFIVPVKPAAA